jgi:hypothetical protein
MDATMVILVSLTLVAAVGALYYARRSDQRTKRANILLRSGSWGMGHDSQVCSFIVYNSGPAVATNVRVRARNSDGLDVSSPAPTTPPTILPGSTPSTGSIEVSSSLLSGSLKARAAWSDDAGEHDEVIGELPAPQ